MKVVLAGIGGQGVIFATRALSQAALAVGQNVLASEAHGMSQRGGSVASHVKLGGDAVGPLIRRGTADVLIGFERNETLRHLPYLRAGGTVFVNTSEPLPAALSSRLGERGIAVETVDADRLAIESQGPGRSNVLVLGFAAAHPALGIPPEALRRAVAELSGAAAREQNLRLFDRGAGACLLTRERAHEAV
jgi:indolepyruvate ferredoxin oxidoreductase beta subunit